MKRFNLIIILLASLFLSACSQRQVSGSGEVVTEERSLSAVTGVELSTIGDLTIQYGDQESIQIEAEENLLPYIDTSVRDGMLTIRTKNTINFNPNRPIRYTLTVLELEKIHNTSLGSITAPQLRASDFVVEVHSSGNVSLDGLNASTLAATLTSLGNLEIGGGEVETQKINISSSGDYLAGDLHSRAARLEISSLGDATIWVTDLLDVVLNSSGSVSYYGDPQVESDITSLGKVIPLGDR